MARWVDIIGFEGRYSISDQGQIKSLPRKWSPGEKIIAFTTTRKGYHSVTLSKNSVTKTYQVHQLVARTFIKNELKRNAVNHINGVKTDNTVSNLEWCTNQENTTHAEKTGLVRYKRLSDSDLISIIIMHRKGHKQKDIAAHFDVKPHIVYDLTRRKTHKHLNLKNHEKNLEMVN